MYSGSVIDKHYMPANADGALMKALVASHNSGDTGRWPRILEETTNIGLNKTPI